MGMGEAGVREVVAGNWPAAKEDFTRDYQKDPAHPIAVFNMGATYHHDGNIDRADSEFQDAVVRGKHLTPDISLEPAGSGVTIAELACSRLHRDNKLDVNCGDRIVAIETPPPAPAPTVIAQAAPAPAPAPAMEAQATTVAPPKQDRN